MNVDITFQYPPELMSLLTDTIPRLNRSKKDVFLFFQGAGVSDDVMKNPKAQWERDKESINKYEITRLILTKLNERGEVCLRERREVLKRIVQCDDFTSCWDNDRLEAQGLVSRIRDVVNVKDSFARMNIEREKERKARQEAAKAKRDKELKKQQAISAVREDIIALLNEKDTHKRGVVLESVLNRLFKIYGILVREAFTICGDAGEGAVEQIDGVIEFDGHHYLVEMKWWNKSIGKPQISQSLVNVYHRGQSRGIFISASGYSGPAITVAKEALQKTVVLLCELREIVLILESGTDLRRWLKEKINCAISEKNPLFDPIAEGKL